MKNDDKETEDKRHNNNNASIEPEAAPKGATAFKAMAQFNEKKAKEKQEKHKVWCVVFITRVCNTIQSILCKE